MKLSGNDYSVRQWIIETLADKLDNVGGNIFGSKKPTLSEFKKTLNPIALGIIASELHLVCLSHYRGGGLEMSSTGYKLKTVERVWKKMDAVKFWADAYEFTYDEY
tara:strand:- start:941 stop:1258 length:318 start_codon:yes stop_codon:yes gene_type:complete